MFEFLLFLLILFYVVPKLIKLWLQWYIRRRQREAQQRMSDMFNSARGRTATDEQGEQPYDKHKKKKIDSNVGEYVSFEEISTDSASAHDTDSEATASRKGKSEPQVEDAEWEDIK